MEATKPRFPSLTGIQVFGAVFGIAGLGYWATTVGSNPETAWQSYTYGFFAWLTLSLGLLGLTILVNLVKAKWGLPFVRFSEAGVRMLVLMLLLAIPLVFVGLSHVYPWAKPGGVPEWGQTFAFKKAYLEPGFFTLRMALYFAIWLGFGFALIRLGKKQDETGDPNLENRRSSIAAAGAVFYVLAVTFAVTDLIMSLEEHWYSTIFGLLNVAGQALAGTALVTVFLISVRNNETYEGVIPARQWRDLGNLLFTLVVFWAYLAFSQLLIIWSGNLPEEITYYMNRSEGPWFYVGVAICFLHFLLPFLLLLSSRVKKTPGMLAGVAVFILLMRAAEVTWAVIPSLHREGLPFLPTDAAAFIGIGGIWVAVFCQVLKSSKLIPSYAPVTRRLVEHA